MLTRFGLSISDGLSWAAVILTAAGAALSAYSSANVPADFVAMMGTIGGLSKVAPKIVLEQKAYGTVTLIAILLAFAAQLLSMIPSLKEKSGGGLILVLAVLATAAIWSYTNWQKHNFVLPYQREMARLQNGQGQLTDVVSAQSDPAKVVRMLEVFYDFPMGRNEPLAQYRARLATRIQELAR